MQQPESHRRRRVLAGIGAGIVAASVGTATAAAQDQGQVTVTLNNVGTSAWEVTNVEGDDSIAEVGDENPTLILQEGVRYTFENNGWSFHPLAFLDGDGNALLSQSEDGSFEGDSEVDWIDEGETVSFTLTSGLAEELAGYICTVHSSMEGTIEVESAQGETTTVSISDQSTDGTSVVVDSTTLPDGGFVTIHDSSLLDGEAITSVRGTSDYLDAGDHEDTEVELDDQLVEDDTLIAMPHRDTNGNETYDFVETEGEEDGPYSTEEGAVTDSASVTVTGDGTDENGGMDDDESMDNETDDQTMDDGSADDSDESADDGGPGFGPVAGIAGLGGLVTYAYRKLDLDSEPPTPADDGLDEESEE